MESHICHLLRDFLLLIRKSFARSRRFVRIQLTSCGVRLRIDQFPRKAIRRHSRTPTTVTTVSYQPSETQTSRTLWTSPEKTTANERHGATVIEKHRARRLQWPCSLLEKIDRRSKQSSLRQAPPGTDERKLTAALVPR